MKKSVSYYAWVAFICACLVQLVFTGIIYNPLSLYTAPILEEFPDLSRTSYAVSLTLMSGICAVANMCIGWLKKKINIRGILILGGAVMTVGCLLYANANGLGMIYVAASLVGIAFAFLASAITATMINTWFARNSGLLVGITLTLAGLGGTIFSPVVGSWIASVGWRQTFYIVAIVSAVSTAVIGLLYRSEPSQFGLKPLWIEKAQQLEGAKKEEEILTGIPLKQGIKTINFWATIIVWLGFGILVYSVMGILAIYVQDLGYDATAAGAAIAPMFTVNMIIPFAMGWLTDRIHVKWITAGGLLLFLIALVILLSEPQLSLVYVVAILTGVGMATARGTLPPHIRKTFGVKYYATYIGIGVGVFSGGIAIGNPIIAAFYDATGTYATAMKFYIPALIIVVIMVFLAAKKIKVKHAAEAE